MTESGRGADEPKGTISFSVRLTVKERERLTKAAEKRGWSLTGLMKTAALEKATHILNTSAPNRVDFQGAAEEIARQVFTPRSARTLDFQDMSPVVADVFEHIREAHAEQSHNPVEVSPWHMPPDFLTQVRDAARYGGTEFLELIIQAADTITSRNRSDLPPPMDPNSI